MRKIEFILLLIIYIATSCGKDSTIDESNKPSPEEAIATLKLSPDETINSEYIGGIFRIMLTANKDWSIDSDREWVGINPKLGDAVENQEISITIGANQESSNREANIIFKCGEVSDTLKVTQKKIDTLINTHSKITIGARVTDFSVKVDPNVESQVDIKSEWIVQKIAQSTSELTFMAQQNDGDKRIGTIVISNDESSETITITQEKGDFIITKNKYQISSATNIITVNLESNDNLEIKIQDEWIHLMDPIDRTMRPSSFQFEIDKNTDNSERVGSIIISNHSKSDTIYVIQGNDVFDVSIDSETIPYSGGVVNATVIGNLNYTIETPSNINWIVQSNEKAITQHTHKFQVSPNNGVGSRSATIRFNYQSPNGDGVKEVIVTQHGHDILVDKNLYNVDAKGGHIDISLKGDTEFDSDIICNITKGADWISYDQIFRSTSKVFRFNIKANSTAIQREGEVEFMLRNRSSVKVSIIQSANTSGVYIADENFKLYLVNNFDTNCDGEISKYEAMQIFKINCSSLSIKSLIGIENFTNLNSLNCRDNNITNIDISNNQLLTSLNVSNNELKLLDISTLSKLTDLSCNYNPLEILKLEDVSPIRFYSGNIYEGFLKYPVLNLKESKTFKLISSKITKLDVKKNHLTSLHLAECPKLVDLACFQNPLSLLDLGGVDLDIFYYLDHAGYIKVCDYLELNLERSQRFKLISSKTVKMSVSNSKLTSIDISKSPILRVLSVYNNELKSLDLSNNRSLTRLDCRYNNLTTINLDQNRELKELDCRKNQLKTINISNTALPLTWSQHDEGVTVIR